MVMGRLLECAQVLRLFTKNYLILCRTFRRYLILCYQKLCSQTSWEYNPLHGRWGGGMRPIQWAMCPLIIPWEDVKLVKHCHIVCGFFFKIYWFSYENVTYLCFSCVRMQIICAIHVYVNSESIVQLFVCNMADLLRIIKMPRGKDRSKNGNIPENVVNTYNCEHITAVHLLQTKENKDSFVLIHFRWFIAFYFFTLELFMCKAVCTYACILIIVRS